MSENLGFRSQTDKKEIDWKAEQLEMNRSEFLNLAVEVLVNFDDRFLKKLKTYSERLRLSMPELITQVMIRRFAEIEEKEIKTDLSEMISPAGYGEDQEVLFNMLKQNFKQGGKKNG
ncbi:MAG: hypothetical protein ACOCXL_00245 [Halanaerobium sp.]